MLCLKLCINSFCSFRVLTRVHWNIHYFSPVQLQTICDQITFRIKHIPFRKMCEIFRANRQR